MVAALLLGFLLLAALALYRYFTKYFDFFKKQGVPFVKPVPLFGTSWGVWNEKKLHLVDMERCKKYGKVFGIFNGRLPAVVVSDPELLKNILVKDFDHFADRFFFVTNNQYLRRAVGFLEGSHWKEMRSILSPTFTTGKIKRMINLMNEPAESLVAHLNREPESAKIDIRGKVTAFVMDVTASVAFGIKVGALDQPNNPFLVKALESFAPEPELQATIPFVLANLYPNIGKHLISASMDTALQYFADVAADIISKRRNVPADSPKRGDFVDILLEAAETNQMLKTDQKMVIAQMIVFLIGGLDTTAFTMSMTLHCLAMHSEVQDKVREELQSAIKNHNGKINYDVIRELPYMDQCISETLRIFPAASRLDRQCVKDIEYKNGFKLKAGMSVMVPVYAIHMDPQNYPNPEVYDPDRFSTAAKGTREPTLHMGFGYGPRGCLGMRFALDNTKFGLAHLLSNFKFVPVPETKDPPEIQVTVLGFLHNRKCFLGIEKLKK